MPAKSESQFRTMKGIASGSIPPKGLPERKTQRKKAKTKIHWSDKIK